VVKIRSRYSLENGAIEYELPGDCIVWGGIALCGVVRGGGREAVGEGGYGGRWRGPGRGGLGGGTWVREEYGGKWVDVEFCKRAQIWGVRGIPWCFPPAHPSGGGPALFE
jgi:hypothetical protein